MRIGFNPNKDKIVARNDFFHQVIVPVYIPNQEDYFKDSLQILKYCLESLFKTCHSNTYFTIVNNGSCKVVVDYLNVLHQSGSINEIIHTSAIGKLNAILKGLIGQNFQLVTIADADVLFLNNWQKETYKIFEGFPKSGVVSTTPNPKLVSYLTSNIIFDKGISKAVKFTNVVNPEALKLFADSIGNPNLFNPINLKKYLTITNGNDKAVVGAGHFVATYRSEVFESLNQQASSYSLGGDSDVNILDKPSVNKGYWRLSTENNYTYHMGNTIENWMQDKLQYINTTKTNLKQPKLLPNKSFNFVNYIKNIIFARIILNKVIWRFFLRFKGLSNEESMKY
jgi:hypothetical protein